MIFVSVILFLHKKHCVRMLRGLILCMFSLYLPLITLQNPQENPSMIHPAIYDSVRLAIINVLILPF